MTAFGNFHSVHPRGQATNKDQVSDKRFCSPPEIRIALADYDCRQATQYDQRIIEIQRNIETRFVKAHQKQLDELLSYVQTNALNPERRSPPGF